MMYCLASALALVVLGLATSHTDGLAIYLPESPQLAKNSGMLSSREVGGRQRFSIKSLQEQLQDQNPPPHGLVFDQNIHRMQQMFDPVNEQDQLNREFRLRNTLHKDNFDKRSSSMDIPEIPPEMLIRLAHHLKTRRFPGGRLAKDMNLESLYGNQRGREDISIGLDLDTLTQMIDFMRRKDKVRSANRKLIAVGKRR